MPSLHIGIAILNICERQCQTRPTCLPRTGHNGEHLYQVSSPAQLTNVSGYTISYTDIWSPTVALRTPAEMETRDNIDKIKCTFIACQSRKITRLMKIFKAKQTSVFCFCLLASFNDIIRERIQCQCQWQSTNVKQQCHEMILNVNDMQTAAIRIISKMFQFVHLTRPVRRCWCSAGSVGGHHIHAVWSFPS